MSRRAQSKVDPDLKKAIKQMVKDVSGGANVSLTDKCKVIDRALKLAAIEAKLDDPGFGTGFKDNDGDD